MSVSACLLTRNEEHNIERALRSVAGVASEVVVADAESTDRTVAIAEANGARVIPIAWADDFGAGRNAALAEAKGDWIFWLNPDEELVATSRKVLPQFLAMAAAAGFIVRVEDQLKADRADYIAVTSQPRLFRRSIGARFTGRLHPHFEVPLDELGRRHSKLVFATTEVILRRHAYLSVLTPHKLEWAKRLLELELRDRPGQLHYLIEYGRTLLLLNDPRGHEVLAEAAEQLLQSQDAAKPPTSTAGSLLEYLLMVSPDQSRSRLSRETAQELALRWFRNTPPVVWAVSQHLFQAGRFVEAVPLLESLLEMGRTDAYDHTEGFDPEILGAPTVMNLGICHTQLRQFDKAQHCFGQLLSHPTYQTKARQNFAMVQELMRR